MKRLALLLLLASATLAVAADREQLPTVAITFDTTPPGALRINKVGDPAFFKTAERSGGNIIDAAWQVAAEAPFGEGILNITLDRAKLAGDVALVLEAKWESDPDVAIQLYDAQGRALVLDLFGDVARNAQTVATDTFIIPLTRYPDAVRVSVRRLTGSLYITGAAVFPVMSELSATLEVEKELAARLGVVLSPRHRLFAPAQKGETIEAPAGEPQLGRIHTVPPLEMVNEIGADVLTETGYPIYKPITQGPLPPAEIWMSCTTADFVSSALRTIALQSNSEVPQKSCGSSNEVADWLLETQFATGFMSVPLTSAQKENFFRDKAHPVVEFPIARDAIQVLVNESNPIRQLTIPQLDAIFGVDLLAGAPQLIRTWNEAGAPGGVIKTFGGRLGWGTARTFQQLVLKGGKFRDDIEMRDVVYSSGVEGAVAGDPDAIGYTALRRRGGSVRALAIARNSGEKAYNLNANSVYSGNYPLQRIFYGYVTRSTLDEASPLERELVNLLLSDLGQTMVARSGSLPLTAVEVTSVRARLGLPR